MKLINWIKSLPSVLLFALQKKRKFVDDVMDDRDEIYHKKITNIEEVAGFRVNQDLVSKVLRIKYEQKYLQK